RLPLARDRFGPELTLNGRFDRVYPVIDSVLPTRQALIGLFKGDRPMKKSIIGGKAPQHL
ncbi:MAG: hypothetical protein GY820_33160, partial [Gammaproteobacteria bacterium]|nr:hypothetical protein [Gammaproteobacteria bacterium]